jgi:hypothetical protein
MIPVDHAKVVPLRVVPWVVPHHLTKVVPWIFFCFIFLKCTKLATQIKFQLTAVQYPSGIRTRNQGDQIGPIFAQCVTDNFEQFYENYRSNLHFRATFCHG